jgi:hypothetical protein
VPRFKASLGAISITGNLTLQLAMYDIAEPGANVDTLSFQVKDASGTLWFSNNWSERTTKAPQTPTEVIGRS